MVTCSKSVDLDAVFMAELGSTLARAAGELSIARGRLRMRSHAMVRALISEAHGQLTRTSHEVRDLADRVWGENPTATVLADVLDVQWSQQALWALRCACEAVDMARACLRRSVRQWVARGHLCDAHGRMTNAISGLTELSRRAWEDC